jgi:fructose-bisphosphate aldolase class II
MTKLCKDRLERFNTAGKASKIRPIPLPTMAKRYASGELNPKFA